jgi:hypothetical protein
MYQHFISTEVFYEPAGYYTRRHRVVIVQSEPEKYAYIRPRRS